MASINTDDESNDKDLFEQSKVNVLAIPRPILPPPPAIPDPESALPTVVIKNMVCSVDVKCKLDLKEIYSRLRFSDYNPIRFPGCIIKLREPRVTGIVFASGKLILFGAVTMKAADLGARKFIRIFQKIGFLITSYALELHNVMGYCDLKLPINLDSLHEVHSQFSNYEPELFPAVIYRLIEPRCVFLIFASGKFIITGAKSIPIVHKALECMYPVLRAFRKRH